MATPLKKFLAALDPQFVLFLEAGASGCQTIFNGLEGMKFDFIITETGLQELAEMAESGSRTEFQDLAKKTLSRLRNHYGIKTPGLKSVENGCAEVIANHLLEKGLPESTLKNEALLIAEASLHECNFLIMLQNNLADLDSQKINLLMAEKGGNPLSIMSSEAILDVLERTSKN